MDSLLVWQICAWCRSRSTVAVAMVLGIRFIKASMVMIGTDRNGSLFVGGIHDPVEPFSAACGDRE